MSNRITLTPRDRALLRLLSWTPATTTLLKLASVSFAEGAFSDERRLRERLSALATEGFVRSWPSAFASGGLQNYYKITPAGFAVLHGPDAIQPARAFFAEISPSFFVHTLRLAEAIVKLVTAAQARSIEILRLYRENELSLTVGQDAIQPDCFVRMAFAGRTFNHAFEIDTSQESIDSPADSSIRRKLGLYHAYQEQAMADWHAAGKRWEEPRFRAVFLTSTTLRAYHILSFARQVQPHRSRRLVYALEQGTFIGDPSPLTSPIFLDHFGHWQALVDSHSSGNFLKAPVRLTPLTPSHFS